MSLLAMFDDSPSSLAGALPTDASSRVVVGLLAEVHELRTAVEYQGRLLEWLADGLERLDRLQLLAQAHAERFTTNPTVH